MLHVRVLFLVVPVAHCFDCPLPVVVVVVVVVGVVDVFSQVGLLEDQVLLARWLQRARSKSQQKAEELSGPWSIEERQKLEEVGWREEVGGGGARLNTSVQAQVR